MAKNRLLALSHVGTTEQLLPSVESCAASLGMRLDGPAYAPAEVRQEGWGGASSVTIIMGRCAKGDEESLGFKEGVCMGVVADCWDDGCRRSRH